MLPHDDDDDDVFDRATSFTTAPSPGNRRLPLIPHHG